MKRILLLCLLCIFLSAFPSQAAPANDATTGGSGTGDSGGSGTMKIIGGPKSTHTGWLVYLIDADQKQISATKVFYSSSEVPGNNYIFYPKTRFGGATNQFKANAVISWTPSAPFGSNGESNGAQIKTFMLKDDYILSFINQHFDLEYFTTNEYNGLIN